MDGRERKWILKKKLFGNDYFQISFLGEFSACVCGPAHVCELYPNKHFRTLIYPLSDIINKRAWKINIRTCVCV